MKKKIAITTGVLIMIFFITMLIFNFRYPFVNPTVGNWSVGFQKNEQIFPEMEFDSSEILTYEYIDGLTPEKFDYIADPFYIKEKDTFYLFVELKGKGNANIALLTSGTGKDYTYKGIILDEEFHLSYPQVFKHKEEFYMLPETVGANNVLLYKAKNFPYDWVVWDTLLKNRHLKDPSLLLDKDLNMIVGVDDDLRQYIFTADSLTGPWAEDKKYRQRRGNETRPGGRFFMVDGTWYLPLQNRSRGYGTGISLFQLKNDKAGFSFEKSHHLYLKPQRNIRWFNRGMHHLDIQEIDGGYYMVYDGDRNDGEKDFQYKRTIKFNLLDLYNYFR